MIAHNTLQLIPPLKPIMGTTLTKKVPLASKDTELIESYCHTNNYQKLREELRDAELTNGCDKSFLLTSLNLASRIGHLEIIKVFQEFFELSEYNINCVIAFAVLGSHMEIIDHFLKDQSRTVSTYMYISIAYVQKKRFQRTHIANWTQARKSIRAHTPLLSTKPEYKVFANLPRTVFAEFIQQVPKTYYKVTPTDKTTHVSIQLM